MVFALRVADELVSIEVHVSQVTGAIPLGFVDRSGETSYDHSRRRRSPPGARTLSPNSIDGDEAVPAGPVPFSSCSDTPRPKRRQ